MKHHIKYYLKVNLLRLKSMTFYTKSFFLELITDIISIVIALLFYQILYLNIGEGLGIPIADLFILVLSVKLTGDLYNLLFASGVHSLAGHIQYGTLDNILIKPLNLFFNLFCSSINWRSLVNLGIDAILFIILISQYSIEITAFALFNFLIVICLATTVFTSFNILIYLGSIVFVRLDAFASLISSFFSLSTFPAAIFKSAYLKWFFIYIIPVLIIGNFPLLALKGMQSVRLYLIIVICVALFTSLAYIGTMKILKHYKSASS